MTYMDFTSKRDAKFRVPAHVVARERADRLFPSDTAKAAEEFARTQEDILLLQKWLGNHSNWAPSDFRQFLVDPKPPRLSRSQGRLYAGCPYCGDQFYEREEAPNDELACHIAFGLHMTSCPKSPLRE